MHSVSAMVPLVCLWLLFCLFFFFRCCCSSSISISVHETTLVVDCGIKYCICWCCISTIVKRPSNISAPTNGEWIYTDTNCVLCYCDFSSISLRKLCMMSWTCSSFKTNNYPGNVWKWVCSYLCSRQEQYIAVINEMPSTFLPAVSFFLAWTILNMIWFTWHNMHT